MEVIFPKEKERDPEIVIDDVPEDDKLDEIDGKIDLVLDLLTKQQATIQRIERLSDAEI